MQYSYTTDFHATKTMQQNTRAIINNYRQNEKKAGLRKIHNPLRILFLVYNRRINQQRR